MVIVPNGKREPVYFLQLAVEHAISQDSKKLVDSAIRYACREWEGQKEVPKLVVRVDGDGAPRPGSPIFEWPFHNRAYCFEHELHPEIGFLGERELRGYLFRAAGEEAGFTCFGGSQRVYGREAGPVSFRLTKILGLISLIEDKGNRASDADLDFLGCLKEKASQLGYSS
jgi:hypothetical protein